MKAVIKFLFTLVVLFTTINIVQSAPDVMTAVSIVLLGTALVTGLVVPARHLRINELYAVTTVKVWNTYIIEKLRRVNDWLMRSRDESRFVTQGAVVYIPNAGADPAIVVDRSSFPASAAQREDNDVNYTLQSFSTDPTHVSYDELQVISYDKIDSVLGAHGNTLAEAVGDAMLIKWAPTTAGQEIATTGADVAGVGNQTGTRKGFTHKDLAKAMIKMNTNNVPKQGRIAVIDDNMYEFFYDDLSDAQLNAYNQFANNATGQLGRLHGFDIYTRSAVLNYAAAATSPNAYAATQLATDNLASLCWQQDMVTRAVGETKLFTDKDNPLYYGDLYSALIRLGGRKVRTDNYGVVAIIQG